MKKPIANYVMATKNLFSYFGCKETYAIRVLNQTKWLVRQTEGSFFLEYFANDNPQNKSIHYVLLKKDNSPQIFETKEHTMVIAIDCIKFAFVLHNKDRL